MKYPAKLALETVSMQDIQQAMNFPGITGIHLTGMMHSEDLSGMEGLKGMKYLPEIYK